MRVVVSSFFVALLFMSFTFALVDESELNKLLDEASLDPTPITTEGKTTAISGGGGEDPETVTAETAPVAYHQAAPVHTDPFPKIVNRMYQNGLTSFSSVESFNGAGLITRQEMAKFISLFSLYVGRQRNANPNCGFKDILQAQRGLVPYVISACSMSLLNGSNGYAKPNNQLTKAEAITTIMRTVRNDLTTNANPRYKNYYNTARAYGITYDDMKNMNHKVTRKEVAIMFWRACVFKGKCSE